MRLRQHQHQGLECSMHMHVCNVLHAIHAFGRPLLECLCYQIRQSELHGTGLYGSTQPLNAMAVNTCSSGIIPGMIPSQLGIVLLGPSLHRNTCSSCMFYRMFRDFRWFQAEHCCIFPRTPPFLPPPACICHPTLPTCAL